MNLRQWFRHVTWNEWPQWAYRHPAYQQRLTAVQEHLAAALAAAPLGRIRLLSICSGDGRDVLGVLQLHPRRDDVTAWLVEKSAESAATGARQAQQLGLDHAVRFLSADATVFDTYQGIAPADIILLCGVWGHVPVTERQLLVDALMRLCAGGGVVIWTRAIAKGMRRLEQIRSHFWSPTWQELSQTITPDCHWAVVTHRYGGASLDVPARGQLFHFQAGAGTR
jgi:putative methyltransferase